MTMVSLMDLEDRVVGGITNYLLSGMILKNSWKLVNLVHLFLEKITD